MNQEKIGQFIRKIRQDNNLTQKDLADKLGVTYQAVSKWENGKNIPDIATLKLISEEFNLDINEILEGQSKEKKAINKKYYYIAGIIIIVLLLLVTIFILNQKSNSNFEFKTISSKCSDFKITGSAAYNKEKTAIYISNIEFCGKEDNTVYKKIGCTLYERNNDTKTKISGCHNKNNKSLKEFLKEVNINVNNYSSSCKKLTSNTLLLEIEAYNEETKKITYSIPLKLDDNCK